MAYEAQQLWDRELGFNGLRQTRDGWEGRQFYRVDTHDPYLALTARPIPAMNAPWSPALPSLIVVARTPEWYRGFDAAANDPPYGGHSIVRVDYQEIGRGGLPPPGLPGQQFTQLSSELETVTVFFTNAQQQQSDVIPLANGEGAPQLVGTTKAAVSVDYPLNANVDLGRLIDLTSRQLVNDRALTFPPVLGSSSVLTVGPGQARYEGHAEEVTGSALRVTHTIALGRDMKFRWRIEDDNGNATGVPVVTQLYDVGSLQGLWS